MRAAHGSPMLLGSEARGVASDVTGMPFFGDPAKRAADDVPDASPLSYCSSVDDLTPAHQEEPQEEPPEGHTVLRALTLIPLGGVFWEVFLLVTDLGLDSVQIRSFVRKQHYIFASLTSAVVGCTVFLQSCHLVPWRWPAHAAKSVKIGALTDELSKVFFMERSLEAPASTLIIPYGLLLMHELPTLSGIVAILSLLASIRAIGTGIVQDQDTEGGKHPLGAAAVLRTERPKAFLAMRAGVLFAVAADIVVFAVTSLCLHPAIAVLALMVTHLLAAFERGAVGLAEWILLSRYMWPAGFSSFGLRVGSVEAINAPARLRLMYMALRPLACLMLVASVELPQGLAPFGSLGRPMGRSIFEKEIVDPVQAVLAGTLKQEWPVLDDFSTAALGYRAFLALVLLVSVPVSVVTRAGQAMGNPFAADGSIDEPLNNRVRRKEAQIQKWMSQRKLRLNDKSPWQLLADSLPTGAECCA